MASPRNGPDTRNVRAIKKWLRDWGPIIAVILLTPIILKGCLIYQAWVWGIE